MGNIGSTLSPQLVRASLLPNQMGTLSHPGHLIQASKFLIHQGAFLATSM